jgi:hypothetical protein
VSSSALKSKAIPTGEGEEGGRGAGAGDVEWVVAIDWAE